MTVGPKLRQKGVALIICMFFVMIFAALAASMATFSATNLEVADNQKAANAAFCAAESGLNCAKYIVKSVVGPNTFTNYVTKTQADDMWNSLGDKLITAKLGGQTVSNATSFTVNGQSGEQILVSSVNFADNCAFSLRFYRYDNDPCTIKLTSTGSNGAVCRTIAMDMKITKKADLLNYAIVSCGRMIITGDTKIHGNIFSTWNKPKWHAPFETTAETDVEGSIGTVLSASELAANDNSMETLDANGNPVYDQNGNRVRSSSDTIQGNYDGTLYEQSEEDDLGTKLAGLSADDYDTTSYKTMCSNNKINASSTTTTEYFPHQPGQYNKQKDGSSSFTRNVYSDTTYTNAYLPKGRNALFKNCTFNGALYIESSSNTTSSKKCNNVRFENCTFNGIIVTDVPTNGSNICWVQNCLYFTGTAEFDNQSDYKEATILAPNFNVNLGNTATFEENGDSQLTGAIVGGIVDVRGNANIIGTIISMFDTTIYKTGYVTNIGFAEDGGDEGGLPEDVGTISITPRPDQMLPGGMKSPIIIVPIQDTYTEIH